MPPVQGIVHGLNVTVLFQKGEIVPMGNRSTNWPLFADLGVIDRSRDPLSIEEKPIHVFLGPGKDFADVVFVCVVDIEGDRFLVAYIGFSDVQEVMKVKAGVYLSSEVERVVIMPMFDFANQIRTSGTLRLESEVVEMEPVIATPVTEVAEEV